MMKIIAECAEIICNISAKTPHRQIDYEVFNRVVDIIAYIANFGTRIYVLVKQIKINFAFVCIGIADKLSFLHIFRPFRNGSFILFRFLKSGSSIIMFLSSFQIKLEYVKDNFSCKFIVNCVFCNVLKSCFPI